MNIRTLVPVLAALLTAASVHAATLVEYDFEGFTPGASTSTGTLVATAYDEFAFGSGLEAGRIQYQYDNPTDSPAANFWLGWDGNMFRTRQNAGLASQNVGQAVTNNGYFSFTYTPGGTVSLDSLDLESAVRMGAVSEPLTARLTLRSSLTGTTDLGSFSVDARVELSEHDDISFDLSGYSEFQNITSPVTFTVYVDNIGVTQRREVFVDNISIQGVPEPGSVALFAIGCSALLWRSRRRSAAANR
jgi:hypothetical protein